MEETEVSALAQAFREAARKRAEIDTLVDTLQERVAAMSQWPNVQTDQNGSSAPGTPAASNLSNVEIIHRIEHTADLDGKERSRQRFNAKELELALQALQPASKTATSPIGTIHCVFQDLAMPISALVFSPDEKQLAFVQDGVVNLYDLNEKRVIVSFAPHVYFKRHAASVTDVAWSPEGRYLACARSDGRVEVLNVETGKPEFLYEGHNAPVRAVAWSGSSIASGDDDGQVQAWSVYSRLREFEYSAVTDNNRNRKAHGITSVAWGRGGRWFASGSENCLVQVGLPHRSQPASYDTHTRVTSVAFAVRPHEQDDYVIVGHSGHQSSFVQVLSPPYPPEALKNVRSFQGHRQTVRAVACLQEGYRVASAGEDGTVQIWDYFSGKSIFTYRVHPGAVTCLSWVPKRRWIASADEQGIILVWQAE